LKSSNKEWLVVGRVGKPHGIHGDILVEVITDFPERLSTGVRFGIGPEKGPQSFHETHAVRFHKARWLLSTVGIRSRELIEEWRGQYLYLPEQSLDELPEGYYYEHHLAGLKCCSVDGEDLGTITGFDPDDTQIRIIVRREKKDYSVPWVPAIIIAVDLEAGTVTLDPPKGLLDDDAIEIERS